MGQGVLLGIAFAHISRSVDAQGRECRRRRVGRRNHRCLGGGREGELAHGGVGVDLVCGHRLGHGVGAAAGERGCRGHVVAGRGLGVCRGGWGPSAGWDNGQG